MVINNTPTVNCTVFPDGEIITDDSLECTENEDGLEITTVSDDLASAYAWTHPQCAAYHFRKRKQCRYRKRKHPSVVLV